MTPSGPGFDSYIPAPFGFSDQPCKHAVLFYFRENFLTRTLCDFVVSSLQAGGAVVILAARRHRCALAERVGEREMDIAKLKSEGRYVEIDGDEILSACMTGRTIDVAKLELLIGQTVVASAQVAQAADSQLMVFGELVALLWARRDFENLRLVEQFWDDLGARIPFLLLCGYPIGEFVEAGSEESYLKICAMHSTVIPPEAYPTAEVEERIMRATLRSYKASSAMPMHG